MGTNAKGRELLYNAVEGLEVNSWPRQLAIPEGRYDIKISSRTCQKPFKNRSDTPQSLIAKSTKNNPQDTTRTIRTPIKDDQVPPQELS